MLIAWQCTHADWPAAACSQAQLTMIEFPQLLSLLTHYFAFCSVTNFHWAEQKESGQERNTVGAVYLCLLYNLLTFLEWNGVMVPDGFFFKSFLFLPFVHWRKLKYHWQRNPASSWEGHLCTGLPLPCVWFACRNLWLVLSVRKNRDTNQEKCPFPSFKFPFPKTETGT